LFVINNLTSQDNFSGVSNQNMTFLRHASVPCPVSLTACTRWIA